MSDSQTEYQLRDRVSCMRLFSLDRAQGIPDAKALGLVREPLAAADVVDALVEPWDP
ncbi:MAG TPA: hypothetical protein PKM72_08260 [Nitrospirales bacterium]|nr:hypothetical protein [Nitrospirales bacterium]